MPYCVKDDYEEVFAKCGTTDLLDSKASTLSNGQAMRVSLALGGSYSFMAARSLCQLFLVCLPSYLLGLGLAYVAANSLNSYLSGFFGMPPLPPLPRLAPCRFLRLAPYLPLGNFPPALGQEEKGLRRSPPFKLLFIFRQLIFPKSPQNKQFPCNIAENYILRGFRDVFFNVVALG